MIVPRGSRVAKSTSLRRKAGSTSLERVWVWVWVVTQPPRPKAAAMAEAPVIASRRLNKRTTGSPSEKFPRCSSTAARFLEIAAASPCIPVETIRAGQARSQQARQFARRSRFYRGFQRAGVELSGSGEGGNTLSRDSSTTTPSSARKSMLPLTASPARSPKEDSRSRPTK